MKTILCPTDFSPIAQNAILYASEFAKRSGALLIIFHSEFFPEMVSNELEGGDNEENQDKPSEMINFPSEYIGELRDKFECMIVQLKLNYPDVKYKYVVEEGLVAENIAYYSNKHNIDLVIMGTSGAVGLQALLEGSNAVNVMEKVNCPVLIIPEKVDFKSPEIFVYATDLRENEAEIIKDLLQITAFFDAELEVLHFNEDDDKRLNSESFLQSLVEQHSNQKIKQNIMSAGNPVEAIEEYAKSKADILVMSNKKKNFLEKLFNRSTAEKIAYSAEVPLLVIQKP